MLAKNAFLPRWCLCLVLPVAAACNPTYNWRETRVDHTPLTALLPCKPDHGSRSVPLAGQAVTLTMLGCDAGDATFAIAWAELPQADTSPDTVLMHWKQAMLSNMQATESQATAFALKGSLPLRQPAQLIALGRRSNGRAVAAQAVWFVKGTQVFQAVVYADRLTPQMTEPYFAGLQLP